MVFISMVCLALVSLQLTLILASEVESVRYDRQKRIARLDGE